MTESAVVTLSPALVKEALALAASGYETGVWIRTDTGRTGLQVRVEGRNAVYILRCSNKGKSLTRTLGPVLADQSKLPPEQRTPGLRNVSEARLMAREVRERFVAGLDVSDAWISARRLGQDAATADRTAATVEHVAAGSWTYEDLVERYVALKTRERVTKSGEVRPPKKKSESDVRRYMTYPSTAHLRGRLVRDLTVADLERARDEAWATGATGPQRKIVVYVRGALTWAMRKHAAASGLHGVAPWWLAVEHLDAPTKAQRASVTRSKGPRPLGARDAARLLFVAEKHRVVPGREQSHPTDEVVLAALWWLVLGVQWSHASAGVEREHVYPPEPESLTTWWNVEFDPLLTKSGRWHTLSISQRVYDKTIGRALAAPDRRKGSRYVFPSTTSKDRGRDSHTDRPLGDSALNILIDRLRGKRALVRGGIKLPPSGIDLLEGMPPVSPHKLRSALTTELADLALPAGGATAVLDHKVPGDKADEAHVESEVTRRHYNKSAKARLKYLTLEAWADRVFEEYEALRAAQAEKDAIVQAGIRRRMLRDGLIQKGTAKVMAESKPIPVVELPGDVTIDMPVGWQEEQDRHREQQEAEEARRAEEENARAAAERKPLSEGLKALLKTRPDDLSED
ncbi:hypothetical protein [Chenggangzhangella methanolivorans]|uniref:Integrase DNA-binding domain-containing protein n=1 Tax=Chenggangzhangella methanolivorans TaxID=1437009 RepID=A0A9E6UM38_9HYPH|nr:hypothetical protein [Chenggangzhangella methanolivorans]QZN99655.1 hypothetical protein K6K41_23650 [Chenggangzhangella methanolivorans]